MTRQNSLEKNNLVVQCAFAVQHVYSFNHENKRVYYENWN